MLSLKAKLCFSYSLFHKIEVEVLVSYIWYFRLNLQNSRQTWTEGLPISFLWCSSFLIYFTGLIIYLLLLKILKTTESFMILNLLMYFLLWVIMDYVNKLEITIKFMFLLKFTLLTTLHLISNFYCQVWHFKLIY